MTSSLASEFKPPDVWSVIPEQARDTLMIASVGPTHLLQCSRRLLAAAQDAEDAGPTLRRLALDMLLACFHEDPLNAEAAQEACRVANACGIDLSDQPTLLAVAALWPNQRRDGYLERLFQRKEHQRIDDHIRRRRAKKPDNLHLLERAKASAMASGELDGFLFELGRGLSGELSPLANRLTADILFLRGECDQAAALYKGLPPDLAAGVAEKLAECRLRLGDQANARQLWRQSAIAKPWHVNLLLRVHDALTGRSSAIEPPQGSTAVLLYSYNKTDELSKTLDALFASRLGDARVVVLDNGSEDNGGGEDCVAMLRAKRDIYGADRMDIVRLPTNIGAPAARNWLLSLPQVRQTKWCAFLDDDAFVPPDWLGRLGAAAGLYPEAGVWGCKVCDDHAAWIIQHADMHMLPSSLTGDFITLSRAHHELQDQGAFDYIRPCLSVTGCCHLFRTDRLLESGDFSIALSPTQYDDIEHDFRLALAGRGAVYQGFLKVRHLKRSGKAASRPAEGSSQGNRRKLMAMYDPADTKRIMQWNVNAATQDFFRKLPTALEYLFD